MTMDNKTVLVTGSTDGVGRLVALRLADQGARVLIHGRDRQRGDQVVEQIRNSGHSAVFLPADFSSLSEVRRQAAAVRQENDRLDILINNAGIGSGGSASKRRSARTATSFASRSIIWPGSSLLGCCCLFSWPAGLPEL
jgi:NAD(P)-dependent dehydrogenase (short-subunit alcohol dehydrogenase family)